MQTTDDLRQRFELYFDEMERCKQSSTYWALLHLLVALPDICAALENPTERAGTRYIRWCRQCFDSNSTPEPDVRWDIRNALLHQGTTLLKSSSKIKSVSFVEPGATAVEIHQHVSPDGENLTLNIEQLAGETRGAMERWFTAIQGDVELNAKVEKSLMRLARRQTKLSLVPIESADGSRLQSDDGSDIQITVKYDTTSST